MKARLLELLAPAKNPKVAFAAVDSGADAVYMGFESLGARVAAANSLDEIKQVVDYAHLFGVKVYVTLNTIVYEEELAKAERYVWQLKEAGVDAIIVQDMAYLQINAANMTLHTSTQADSSSLDKVKFFSSLGIERAVLAREMTIDQIAEIHRQCPEIELECFVHGALCCSYSGQCYLSHYQSGRSANRGECCQSCRSSYDLLDKNGNVLIADRYFLSTKDLNASLLLGDLIRAGAVTFKIEGRLKDEGYVRNVTAYYSRLLDEFCKANPQYARSSYGRVQTDFSPDLYKSFNRGFTTFNLKGKSDKTGDCNFTKSLGEPLGKVLDTKNGNIIIATNKPLHSGDGMFFLNADKQAEGFLINHASGNTIKPNRKISLPKGTMLYRNRDTEFEKQLSSSANCRKIGVKATLNDTTLRIETENGCVAEVETPKGLALAEKTQDYEENLRRQIGKMGSTVFELTDFSYDCAQKYFFPASVLNDLRRRCLERLQEELQKKNQAAHTQNLNLNVKYIKPEADYRENVSNSQSAEFYRSKGVKIKEYALETQSERQDIELMRSKNCLRYNLGECLQRNRLSKGFEGDLFLRDNNHTYRLEFDCSKCEMSLWTCE